MYRMVSLSPSTCCSSFTLIRTGLDTLVSLQWLDLSSNHIVHIDGLTRLRSLRHLNLSSNAIEHIRGTTSVPRVVLVTWSQDCKD